MGQLNAFMKSIMNYQEIEGDLIKLAIDGEFDVITHGCNCLCNMGAGIAPQMAKAFGADKFTMEHEDYRGDINKLGSIDYKKIAIGHGLGLAVVNSYTQFSYGKNHADGVSKPLDYDALTLCMRKINHIFKGKHIGLPKIGAGLAGGDWNRIKNIIQTELKDMKVSVVIYKP
jgi:O-acetyl-ADP-ribose deacetylase (regulator of RNase III)